MTNFRYATRREFLQGAKRWSAVVTTLALTGGVGDARGQSAGWVNGGGWINSYGGGWNNRGAAWANRGSAWANRGGWINGGGGGWNNRGGSWANGSGGAWVNRYGGGGVGWINR